MQPSTEVSASPRPIIRSYAWSARAWISSDMPICDQSLTRRRMVRSEQPGLAIRSYPLPWTRACTMCSKTIRSGTRRR